MNLLILIQRLFASLQRRRLESELDDEILAHLELAQHEAMAQGLTPEEAAREARRQFGGIAQIQEDHRDARTVNWLETILRDLRLGAASLKRDPVFACITIVVLALGIGANTAMFSLLDATLLRPLPFPEPARIVRVWETPSSAHRNSVNTLDFLDWQRMNTVFQALAAENSTSATLTGDGDPERVPLKLVTAAYFQVFAVNARMGRTFEPADDTPGAEPVLVLSHASWQGRFGGRPDIIGHKVLLDGEPHRVVGVLPPGPFDREQAALWKPLQFTPSQRTRGFHWLLVAGRLAPGVTIQQANQQMLAIDARLTALSPPWKRDWTVSVDPFRDDLVGEKLKRSIYIAFGAVVFVLLIACANVANLLLARGAARTKEMAVRAALGASRGRLVGQLLTETLVLCIAGGVVSIAVAHLLLRAAVPLLDDLLPFTAEVGLDLRVLTFAAAIAFSITLAVGLLPSLQTSAHGIASFISQAHRGSSQRQDGLRRTIVSAEVAVSLVLICGALLLLKSLFNLQSVSTGIRSENVMTTTVDLPLSAYPTAEQAARFYSDATDRLRGLPGMIDASFSSAPPLERVGEGMAILNASRDKWVDIGYKRVSPEYFSTLGIPLLSGRSFTGRDRAGSPPVIVINQALAARITEVFGIATPVGHSLDVVTPDWVKLDSKLVRTEIVGIIRSELTGNPAAPEAPVAYIPIGQVPPRHASIVLRTTAEPVGSVPSIRQAIRSIDPHLAPGEFRTVDQIRQRSLSGASQPASVIAAFAVVALLLAALGLYGVLAHAVTRRRKEIGIRLALGAAQGNIVRKVLREAGSMILVGLVCGLAGAFALTRLMKGILYAVPPLDPSVLAAGCLTMAVVGLAAAFVPSMRAARLDPVRILREDG